jgi:hypothetical protein
VDAVQSAIERLLATPGIVSCWVLPDEEREELYQLEANANSHLRLPGIEMVNEGIREVLQRDHVLMIAHSPELRHPPKPIVLVLNGEEIVGEEIWEQARIENLAHDKNFLLLGKNLALNREALAKAKGKNLKLVYKGLPFPELDEIPGLRDVISITVTGLVHTNFSRRAGWNPNDPNIGTVLVGFNESSNTTARRPTA